MIKVDGSVMEEILNSLAPMYDEDEVELAESRIGQMSVINESIAFIF